MTTDSEIVRTSLVDPPAFAVLFDRHAASIHRFAARRTNETVADDVVSGTFLVAFERRGRFDLSRSSAVPWLYGIATKVLHRHRRDEARMLRALSRMPMEIVESDAVDPAPGLADRVDAQRAIADLAHALRSLPTTQRDALLLLAWADLRADRGGSRRSGGNRAVADQPRPSDPASRRHVGSAHHHDQLQHRWMI